jgi:hypothetical protein
MIDTAMIRHKSLVKRSSAADPTAAARLAGVHRIEALQKDRV